jgi:sucrose-6-phosphate hydrolase SacC (GH32 family)
MSDGDDDVRPMVHFTPPVGWMNDPNGLVSVDGQYHLFFQHHPHSTDFAEMHWGHAVSRDFLTWEHLPTALAPDEHGLIFSGSAVVDRDGTAGFGAGTIVAAFTYHDIYGPDRDDALESQAIAWSTDGGRTFTKFDGNPVIPVDAGRPMSRDPKVFRYSHGRGGHWVMVLSATSEIRVFTSDDLRTWELTDAVGDFDDAGMSLETPDLFPLVADDGTTHWVLTAGIMRGSPAGGGGTAMLLGDFDGRRFTPRGAPRWVDHGASFYAVQSWNDVADGRRVWIGWMGNWAEHAPPPPDGIWRGQMSVPREVTLRALGSKYVLEQRPVRELGQHLARVAGESAVAGDTRRAWRGRALEVTLPLARDASARVVASRRGADAFVTVDRTSSVLTVEVPEAVAGFGPDTGLVRSVPLPPIDVELRVVLDAGSIEVFAGPAAITDALALDSGEWTVTTVTLAATASEQHQQGGPTWQP